jgi:hypothetical protein
MRARCRVLILTLLSLISSMNLHDAVIAQQLPPEIVQIEMPAFALSADNIEIMVRVKNNGAPAEVGYITVSFPNALPETEFVLPDSANMIEPGTRVVEKPDTPDGWYGSTISRDPMVEARFFNWQTGAERELRFQVLADKGTPQLTSYIRATLCYNTPSGRQYLHAPSEGQHIDQQRFAVETRVTEIIDADTEGTIKEDTGSGGSTEGVRPVSNLTSDNPPAWMAMATVLLMIGMSVFIAILKNPPVTQEGLQRKIYRNLKDQLPSLYKAFQIPMQTKRRQQSPNNLLISLWNNTRDKLDTLLDRLLNRDKKRQAAYLVGYLYRRDRIQDLLKECKRQAPQKSWQRHQNLRPAREGPLERILQERFDARELRELCRGAGIDYDRQLVSSNRQEKAKVLVVHCCQENCLDTLIKTGRRQRSDVEWRGFKANVIRPELKGDAVSVLLDHIKKGSHVHSLCEEIGVAYEQLWGASWKDKTRSLIKKQRAGIWKWRKFKRAGKEMSSKIPSYADIPWRSFKR